MPKLLTDDPNALRFLMTEDIYNVNEVINPGPGTMDTTIEESKEQIPAEKPGLEFAYLGENNRYFLVLVEDNSRKELSNEHKEMLLKIMSAKNLELRDLAIVNLALYPKATFSELKEFFSCNRIVLFGINPQKIGLPAIASNKAEKYMDVKVLPGFSLEEMSSNTDKKREFWSVMKGF